MYKTSKQLLKERIMENHADFKAETLSLDEGSIYGMAHRIVAVEEAHFQMTTYDWLGGESGDNDA